MAITVSPLKIFENSSHNLTPDEIQKFIDFNMLYLNQTNQQKKTSKVTLNDTEDGCLPCFNHDVTEFFEDYKTYHGYITLAVSISI